MKLVVDIIHALDPRLAAAHREIDDLHRERETLRAKLVAANREVDRLRAESGAIDLLRADLVAASSRVAVAEQDRTEAQHARVSAESEREIAKARLEPLARDVVALLDERKGEFRSAERQVEDRKRRARAVEAGA